MSHPTEAQARDLFARLRARKWGPLEAALIDALKRDRTGSNIPDGYPASTMGGNGSGVGDPTGNVVVAREKTGRDRHHEFVRTYVEALEAAVVAADTMEAQARNIADLIAQAPTVEGRCKFCQSAGISTPGLHYGTVNGRLTSAADLCDEHYQFVQRHGHIPTSEQTRYRFDHPGMGWRPHLCDQNCELKKD